MVSVLVLLAPLVPTTISAGVLSDIVATLTKPSIQQNASSVSGNLQTVALLRPAMNIDPMQGVGGGDVTVVDNSALLPDEGPSGTLADIQKTKSGTISVYVVHTGDTLGSIAKLFGVTTNTIRWANNLTAASAIHVGDTLVILPVSGVQYTIKKGDTLAAIAKKFDSDAIEIGTYNGIDDATLAVGSEITIPDGELAAAPVAPAKKKSKTINEPAHNVGPRGSADQIAYYIAPLSNYVETQGIHGYNAVDLAAPIGTPIMAAADGVVVIAREGGWNGGYGSYVVIQHSNGSQTLYGHMSKVLIGVGDHVSQGEVIGKVGTTGKSTGPHVHFEIRNGIRNPF